MTNASTTDGGWGTWPESRSVAPPPTELLLVGDALLDRDVIGRAEQLSPESPVPMVEVQQEQVRPGGAGLAALLAARSGHKVTLVAALASDEHADRIRAALAEAGIRLIDLGDPGRTTVMSRVRAADRTLVMTEDTTPPEPVLRPLADEGRAAFAAARAVIVSDYGRGVASAPGVREALAELAGRTPVVWDPHPRGRPPVPSSTVVTPNAREARELAESAEPCSLVADAAHARRLLARWRVPRVAVTRGEGGALLVQDGVPTPLVVPAPRVPAPDTSGAGDHFDVVAAAHLAGGALPSEAVTAAVTATAAHLAAGGATTGVSGGGASVHEDAFAFARRIRAAGGRVVATGGCFDLLHAGHVGMLQQARRLGDCLIVCLNSDRSTRRLKGSGRPIVSQGDRAAMLLALSCVDHVVVFDEDSPTGTLKRLRPDLFVKGGDYAGGVKETETEAVRSWGGEVVVVPYLADRSTSRLIDDVWAQGR